MTQALTRRLYVIAWLTLGTIALVYFVVLFQSTLGLKKERQAAASATLSGVSNSATESADPAVTQALARMREEIDNLKSLLAAANKEKAALQAHIRALETTFGPSTASIPPSSQTPRPRDLNPEDAKARALRPTPVPKVEVNILPMPTDGFADGNPEAPLPIAGRASPRRTLFAVQIGTNLHPGALEERWKSIASRHAVLVQDLQAHSVAIRSSRGNPRYNLIVGPFRNAALAARLCARLGAAGTKCKGTVFAGQPLGDLAAR